MLKKIMVLTTGGTIASKETDNGLAPALSGEELLAQLPGANGIGHIVVRNIMSLDSTNIAPAHWIQLAGEVYEALQTCHGVVVAHGTDTMAYTAAALSCMLVHLDKPVVLTGSQIPLALEESDGIGNLQDALQVASEDMPGVWVVFHGRIIPGKSVRKMYTDKLDAFRSLNISQQGEVKENKVMLWHPVPLTDKELKLDTAMNPKVCCLPIVPGMTGDIIEHMADMGYKGIVLEGFGCGGVPQSLLKSIKTVINRGVILVLGTQCEYDGVDLSLYEVGIEAAKAGILSAGKMTREMAVVRLMWVLGHNWDMDTIRQIMETV